MTTPQVEVLRQTARALLSLRSDAAGAALATQMVLRFEQLDELDRLAFFEMLLNEFGPDMSMIETAVEAFGREHSQINAQALSKATRTQRRELFERINAAPNGTTTLLQMRANLTSARREHPDLRPVEDDLGTLLAAWFNRGFLELRQLDWTTPAHVLEKLIEYEAVHEIQGWDDLRRRLAADRRIFGFFHPALPDEPIIFVEVALTKGLATSIQTLLADEVTPTYHETDTAIFYSITNCQPGLRGVSVGNPLIKRVSTLLAAQNPRLTGFATLSPIPGFADWVSEHHPSTDIGDEQVMRSLAADYLLMQRSRSLPLNAVARFHLRNGSRVEQLNWMGDTSPKGLKESHGMMVNYRYSGQDLDANHEALVHDGIVIASPELIDLLPVSERGAVRSQPE